VELYLSILNKMNLYLFFVRIILQSMISFKSPFTEQTFLQSLGFRWVFLSEEVREEDQRQAGTSGHLAQRLVIWPPSILSDPGAEHRRSSGHVNPAAARPLNHPVTQTAREPAFSLTTSLRVASVTWHWSDVA